jgi:acetyl esterase/lipase
MPVSLLADFDLPLTAVPDVPLTVEKGVTYATAGGKDLKLDLAAPKTGGPFPAVVCFHGGGWRHGGRADLSNPTVGVGGKPGPSIIEAFALRGYAVASVSYRLLPARFPAQIEDAKAAVRFLRANATRFNLDPDRVAALGFSSGGHLALLLGTTDPSAGFDVGRHLDQSSKVKAVVSFFAPADLSLYAGIPVVEDAFLVPLLGPACKTDRGLYRRASPVDHVTKDAAPVLMIHGTADWVVPLLHSERMLKRLRDAGVSAELIPVRGEGHGWAGETAVRTLDAAVRFLDAQLKGKT